MTAALTPDQARALWDAGCFAVLTGLPEGSEYGIDGVFNAVKAFSGTKFLPPGLHILTWAPPSGAASTLPLRSGYVHYFRPRERIALAWDSSNEDVGAPRTDVSDAELRALDPGLAPYPFAQLASWKALSGAVTPAIVQRVLGDGRVDGLAGAEGETDPEVAALAGAAGPLRSLHFPVFDLKRSWRDGATGDDRTKWVADKSVLWEQVVADVGGPAALLGTLQLAFILVLNIWSWAALGAYRRLLVLLTRSASATAAPESHGAGAQAREVSIDLVTTLAAQLDALPLTAFQTELPDLDVFYQDELEALRKSLGRALGSPGWWALAPRLRAAWAGLEKSAGRFGWALGPLPAGDEDSDEDDEDGEYAPVVVET
ncbi:hypothetical protein Q8F55_002536 [Vanrija albida]|uniref:A1 cistron-splicing factor AAR2 n=1 Tax=Vanrija albida TaxID=181172 RepID=A0ABR3QAP4_9TREE